MTDLRRLNVSLTKHGAHKIALLLERYDKDEVLRHISGSVPGVNIELAQAKKTLSADGRGRVPAIWNVAKNKGSETLNALVLIGIIFSHHALISAMQASSATRQFSGRIVRGKYIDGKAYTNFAHIIEQLGYSVEHSADHVDYDLHKLFRIPELNQLVRELLKLKLISAGWDQKNSLVDESTRLRFHEVFSVSNAQFRTWLSTGNVEDNDVANHATKDIDFFLNANDNVESEPFVFQPGHTVKKTGTVEVKPYQGTVTADLEHNRIQNSLVKKLAAKYGTDFVRSECPSGNGTLIDVVLKTPNFCWFYEIKTANSVRACIRQALPQLLEYAYWQGRDDRADRLIIISPLPVTKEAERYLTFLRNKFHLEIYYEQHDEK